MDDKSRTYNPRQLQACAAARLLEDKKSVFVGTGLPMIATLLAQRLHTPGILIVFEAGGIGPRPPVLPISVGDSRTYYRAAAASSMHDTMSMAQAGLLDYGFLGAAQMDCYGNINTTVIGSWERPAVRLPGSGGAGDVGSFCKRTIVIMHQDKQRFVPKVDFVTTAGYLDGPGAREEAGLPADTGPYRVITQLATYGFDSATKRLYLLDLHPGVSTADVQRESSFEIRIPDEVKITLPPSEDELRILRELDPAGISVGR